MLDGSSPDHSEDEVLAQFPDLARARNLYISLFHDSSPLVNLGYIGGQITQAKVVLDLLTESGEVHTHIPNDPYLFIEDPKFPESRSVEISHLRSKQGFMLNADADVSNTAIIRNMFRPVSQNILFDDIPFKVAHIGLFDSNQVDFNDLDFLVRQLTQASGGAAFSFAPLGMQKENLLTAAAKKLDLAVTYMAAWTDGERKHEFMAQIDVPENHGDPVYLAYRKLSPISDLKGSMTPFGRKPSISKDKVLGILQTGKRKVISGELALGNSRRRR